MNKPVLMKNPSSVANGWNGACADWEAYHKELLAPLKEVWLKYGHCIDVLTDEAFAEGISDQADIDIWYSIKQLAERLNW